MPSPLVNRGGPASATVTPQPLTGKLPGTLVGGEHRVQRRQRYDGLLIEHLFDHTRDLREADTPLEKCLDRNLVGRIEHGWCAVAGFGSLPRQAQAREALFVGRLEIQTSDGEQVQR